MEEQHPSQLQKYLDQLKEHTQVSEFNVKEVQMKLPGIKHYWVGQLMMTKNSMNKLQKEKAALKNRLMERVKQASPVVLSTPTLEKNVEGLPELQAFNDKIQEHVILIEFLEKVEKIVHSMTWDLKTLAQIMQMETI